MSSAGKKRPAQPNQDLPSKRKDDKLEVKGTFEAKLETLDSQLQSSNGNQGYSAPAGIDLDSHNPRDKWMRPPLRDGIGTNTNKSIAFQVVDLDYFMDKEDVVIRLFGATATENSICANVRGYCPYFYALAPEDFKEEHREHAINILNDLLRNHARSGFGLDKEVEHFVKDVQIVHGGNIYNYRPDNLQQTFLKIFIVSPRLITGCRNILQQGVDLTGTGRKSLDAFEANIDFEVRFMVDTDLVGCGWVEMKAGKYKNVPEAKKCTTCQIELTINVNDVIVHPPTTPEWSDIAPLRTLSFDIECLGRKGVFPDASQDPVIQIANMVQIQGQFEPFIRNVFVLGTCAPIIGSEVIECKDEIELLQEWSKFIRKVDPDILTGYNIQNFDLPYILERAKALKVDSRVGLLSRLLTTPCKIRDAVLSSKQMGSRSNKLIAMEGRIIFDVLQVVLRDYKLRSYTLNSVSYHFLGEQKEDVEYNKIAELHNGTNLTRRRIAVYCMKDAYLPLRLLDKLLSLINYIEMARVTGVPVNFLIFRGQQIKVVSQLMRKTKAENLFLPVVEAKQADEAYEGATVLEPVRGYYNEPIATLDFASLYPSIMIAHNLCYTTLLGKPHPGMELDKDYIKTPSGNFFVKSHLRKGLLPRVLDDLLAARKKAKNDLKNEKDPFRKMVLNGRQQALKISANSVYGFTGAMVGKLPCVQISQSVTSFGRQMIDETKATVERIFKKGAFDGKCPVDAQVIYGDTDSVMVKFGVQSVAEAMELGKIGAEEVSKIFVKPIKLEFEKVYYPYLLINKKRYAGLYWTKPDKHDKMDCKGLETVRRDNCPLVSKALSVCLEKMLIDRDKDGAINYAKRIISDLLCNRIDISMLIITKELTKTGDKYQAKQAHVELAERMYKRDPGSAPRLGDRVPYVVTAGNKNDPISKRAEHPLYVLHNSLPIDKQYYLEHQLAKPLARIFDPLFNDKAEEMLLKGEHTRTQITRAPKIGGLVGWAKQAKKVPTCLGCKAQLKEVNGIVPPVCDHCMPKIHVIYALKVATLRNAEHRFARLWTECQNCAGTLRDEVFCSAQDCPIFYMREKVKIDLKEQYDVFQRFSNFSNALK